MLTGGHPNSLGNTIEVVEHIFATPAQLADLYECYDSADEVVRLRTSNAFKRVWREQPEWVVPYIDRFLDEVAAIEQASARWTVADLCRELCKYFSPAQSERALVVLKQFLANENDWIVLNNTLKALEPFAKKDAELQAYMRPHLARLAADPRKSVSKKAAKLLAAIG